MDVFRTRRAAKVWDGRTSLAIDKTTFNFAEMGMMLFFMGSNDRIPESAEQDQTVGLCSLILIYTTPTMMIKLMVVNGKNRVEMGFFCLMLFSKVFSGSPGNVVF